MTLRLELPAHRAIPQPCAQPWLLHPELCRWARSRMQAVSALHPTWRAMGACRGGAQKRDGTPPYEDGPSELGLCSLEQRRLRVLKAVRKKGIDSLSGAVVIAQGGNGTGLIPLSGVSVTGQPLTFWRPPFHSHNAALPAPSSAAPRRGWAGTDGRGGGGSGRAGRCGARPAPGGGIRQPRHELRRPRFLLLFILLLLFVLISARLGSASRPAAPRARLPPSMDGKAAPNGVATIEDRILRITGYYGYYPGYSSQKSKALTVPLPPCWASPRQVPSGGCGGGGGGYSHPAAALGRDAGICSFLGAFFLFF